MPTTIKVCRSTVLATAILSSLIATATETTELDCIVEPEMTIELSSPVDGNIAEIYVDKSDRISKGQVLAKLEASVEEAVVALAKVRAASDEKVMARKVELTLAERKKQRIVELYSKQSVPLFEKDEAEAEADLAMLEFKSSIKDRKLAELELAHAKAELELRSVSSPIDGVVVDRYVHPGESVEDKPLLKLAQIDPMRIEIIAPSSMFGLIQEGSQAEVLIEGPTTTRHTATVSIVDSVVDAASGTFGIRLSLPNPENKVVGGLKCQAFLPISVAMPFEEQALTEFSLETPATQYDLAESITQELQQ